VSWDWSPRSRWAVRLYGGTMLFAQSAIAQAGHPEWRLGAEVQLDDLILVDPHVPVTTSPRDIENLAVQSAPQPEAASGNPAVQQAPAPTPPADFFDAVQDFGFGHSPIGPPVHPHDGKQRFRRGRFSYALKYELLLQRSFEQFGGQPGPATFASLDGYWRTHHLMALFQINTRTRHSASNALAVGLEGIFGRNQHGQLVAYHEVKTIALSFSYYW
jgi:hypothetical protein